ncbi:3-oxoacyl-ACP synthase III family protein [Aurantibacillus circumpalustris]|uniref:3-oxoacyl-ACP synthase III family protein n=1 Tax=Aurantibacillus circumpalustris TaxID=3036359 RepID=UPI00295ADB0B|nr:ketoacyl-ACP synthase III [Aurantibacillus circumpalustris]
MGSYIPDNIVTNDNFKGHSFYERGGKEFIDSPEVTERKFRNITGISERRYVGKDQVMSDIAVIAARLALKNSGIDPETLDGIILAHTCGDVPFGSSQADFLPALASKVKHELQIKNPACVAFDILFGCPGWVQGLILARQAIIADGAKRYLVIGAETLSRVIDPHDRDSMIYADGAAAGIIEAVDSKESRGIVSTASLTFSYDEFDFLNFDTSYKEGHKPETRYLKMQGKKIYEFALKNVPLGMKQCLDKSGYGIDKLKKIFIHQANEKMDKAIIRDFYKLYNIDTPPADVLPMNIHLLGNSSVATIPTLLDMVLRKEQENHILEEGDVILFASVGAGMNINAITYVV